MTSKPIVLWVPITELPTLVERKSKQKALNDKHEPMSLPINDLSQLKLYQQSRQPSLRAYCPNVYIMWWTPNQGFHSLTQLLQGPLCVVPITVSCNPFWKSILIFFVPAASHEMFKAKKIQVPYSSEQQTRLLLNLDPFGQRSQYISIKFPLYKQSENLGCATNRDVLLLVILR